VLHRLDGQHVVFGQVLEGMDIVREMEGQGTACGETNAPIIIEDCGEIGH